MSARVLADKLRSCGEPLKPEVVRGVLAGLFLALGSEFASKKLEVRLQDLDLCLVPALARLDFDLLMDHVQLSIGEALMVDSVLFPEALQPASTPPSSAPVPSPSTFSGGRSAAAFPALQENGMPSSRDLRGWLPGFRAHLSPRLMPETLVVYDAMIKNIKAALPAPFDAGVHPQSEIVMTALLTCSDGGLPSTIVLSLPQLVVDDRVGLVALLHILRRTLTVSDNSLGVKQEWFHQPTVVMIAWKLGQVLTEWENVRELLAANNSVQSDLTCRLSLRTMCGKLAELTPVFCALEVAHPDGVPVQTMVDTIRSRAEGYSSNREALTEQASLAAEVGMVADTERPSGREQQRKRPYRTKPCYRWEAGACTFGDKCRFRHDGPAGSKAQAGVDPNGGERCVLAVASLCVAPILAVPESSESSAHLALQKVGTGERNSICNSICKHTIHKNRSVASIDQSHNVEPPLIESDRHNHNSSAADNSGVAHNSIGAGDSIGAHNSNAADSSGVAHNSVGAGDGIDASCASVGIASSSGRPPGVIGDTGATLRVVGRDHLDMAVNIRDLPHPIRLKTANKTIMLTKQCDLPGYHGLMNGAAINEHSQHSLLPIVPICRELNASFGLSIGAEHASFETKDGCLELEVEGNLLILRHEADSESFPGEGLACQTLAQEMGTALDAIELALHTYSSSIDEALVDVVCSECNVAYTEPRWMLAHDLSGHRPHNPKCPYCVQGSMRERRATRVEDHSRPPNTLSLSGDLTGPHEPGVTGSKWAFVGVEITSKYGCVGLQKSKSAPNTLESLKEFVREVESLARDGATITEWHHDNGTEFEGEVYDWVRSRGYRDTNTGGYRPNSNSFSERRIGMLHQVLRTLLLRATNGTLYYEMLWDVGLQWANECINTSSWPNSETTPIETLTGKPHTINSDRHPFGSYCLYKVPIEGIEGKWQPRSEMGIWVGIAHGSSHSHRVVPVKWDPTLRVWILSEPITATRVKVYDKIFPLAMCPSPSKPTSTDFNTFVSNIIQPLFRVLDTDQAPLDSGGGGLVYEVEAIKKKRVHNGQVQYLIKWVGYNNRHNMWRGIDELNCDDLIKGYESSHASVACVSEVMTSEQVCCIADEQASQLFGDCDSNARDAVSELIQKQGLDASVDSFLPGYKNEITEMLRRRLRLLGSSEASRVRLTHALGRLRMILEAKRDGRLKARLILQGFREPPEWDDGSPASPVAYPSSIRTLLFHSGPRSDVISTNDVSVAFLQSDPYPADQDPRYVGYTPYKGSIEWVFELLGSVYGQRSASREWFRTFSSWLMSEGFEPSKNEPCLFINRHTNVKVITFVDDVIVRGSLEASNAFHDSLESRFDCRDGSRQILTPSNPIDFTGITLSMQTGDILDSYFMDQSSAIASFLVSHNLDNCTTRECPMPDATVLTRDPEVVDSDLRAWCKSVNGALHYLARSTRWDISHAVSRLSQMNANPTQGMVDSIRYLAGYLKGTMDFKLGGVRHEGSDKIDSYSDSDHHGDKSFTSKSQTGVLVLLNGTPCHWRSNRQPSTADSPACAEIYAMKEGVRDARLFHWVADEMGIDAPFPFVLQIDSKQAHSFQRDTCPKSKIRGSFDMREDWVQEVRDLSVVTTKLVDTSRNLADIFTKCLPRAKFKRVYDMINNFWAK